MQYLELSTEKGIFPDTLKVAIVRPIFKKGNKEEFGSYRYSDVISNHQHGYMKNKMRKLPLLS